MQAYLMFSQTITTFPLRHAIMLDIPYVLDYVKMLKGSTKYCIDFIIFVYA